MPDDTRSLFDRPTTAHQSAVAEPARPPQPPVHQPLNPPADCWQGNFYVNVLPDYTDHMIEVEPGIWTWRCTPERIRAALAAADGEMTPEQLAGALGVTTKALARSVRQKWPAKLLGFVMTHTLRGQVKSVRLVESTDTRVPNIDALLAEIDQLRARLREPETDQDRVAT